MIILYNPKNGAPIKDIYLRKVYKMDTNTLLKFDSAEDVVARYLLGKYGFLRRVSPEEIPEIKKEMQQKLHACEYCGKEYADKKALNAHYMGKHKLTKEVEKELADIPGATPIGEIPAPKKGQPALTADQIEGIPQFGEDRDGVEWYGPGAEDDSVESSMVNNRVGQPGTFGAA